VNVTTGQVHGVQSSAGVNLADAAYGLQLAGGLNVAREVHGAQIAPLNVSQTASGFRLGVINVGHDTRGFQLGVINVAAHDDGESLAVLNFIGNGIHDAALYGTDALVSNIGIKLGGHHLFTSFSFSYQPGDDLGPGAQLASGSRRWGYGGGLGWRVPLRAGPLAHLDIEAVTNTVTPDLGSPDSKVMLNTARATLALSVARYTTVLVGVGANVMVGTDGRDFTGAFASWGSEYHDGTTTVRLYPAFLLGLQVGTPNHG
jgi:hypothetical protein